MKKTYSKLSAIILCVMMIVSTSCSKDDYQADIDALDNRLTALEADIDAIQSAVESGSTISSVTSTESGIKITLSNGQSYEITNGEDGQPGSVVEIIDGNWYIDGEDSGLAAQGEEGQPGADGTPGVDGTPGADGTPGSYYLPNTETGTFIEYVWDDEAKSYVAGADSGISFLAPGTITATVNGDGTVVLSGVEDGSGNTTTITLGVNRITSLLVSEKSGDGFVFFSGQAQPFAHPYYLLVTAQTALSSNDTYKYVVNPSAATAPESWEVVEITVDTKSGADSKWFVGTADVALAGGYASVAGKFDVYKLAPATANIESRFYLQANVDSDMTVTSNTATIQPTDIKAAFIGDAKTNGEYKSEASEMDDYSITVPELADAANHEILAESATGVNLAEYVYGSTYADIDAESGRSYLGNYNIAGYTFAFSLPETYKGDDGVTNQQKFVTLTDGVLKVDYTTWGTSSIGRTPIVQVDLMSDAAFGTPVSVATAYIKFEITETLTPSVAPDPVVISMSDVTVSYADLYLEDTYEMSMDWTTMNQKVYNNDAIKMTHTEFVANYDVANPVLAVVADSDGTIADLTSTTSGTTPTRFYGVDVDPAATLWSTFEWTVTYKSNDPAKYGDVVLKHKFTVTPADETLPAFEPIYVSNSIQVTKGREVSDRHEMSVQTSEAFVTYLNDYLATEIAINATYNNTTDFMVGISDVLVTGVDLSNSSAIDIAGIQTQVVSLTAPLSESYKDIPMVFTLQYENGEVQTEAWTIRFENPLSISFAAMSIATTDMATTLDVMDYVTVKFNDNVVYTPESGWDATLQTKYGLDFSSVTGTPTAATGTYLTFEQSSTTFTWNNTGTKPVQDFKGADVAVEVTGSYSGGTAYAISDSTADLTILKY